MSTPHYQMSTTWDEQRVAPQLEHEYELDSGMYGVIQQGAPSQQSLARQQHTGGHPLHNSSYSNGFDASYQQNLPQQFNFNIQQPLGQGQQNATVNQNGQGYYSSIPGPSGSSQQQNQQPQQYGQQSLYPGRSPAIGGPINNFQESPVFPQYTAQGVNGPQGYGSSPQQFPQTFSPELGIPGQPGLQNPYLGGADRQAEMYAGPSFKRARTMDNGYEFEQEESDREAGPAPDVVKAKSYVYSQPFSQHDDRMTDACFDRTVVVRVNGVRV